MYRHYASFIYYNLLIEKLNVTVKHHMCALARTTLSLVFAVMLGLIQYMIIVSTNACA